MSKKTTTYSRKNSNANSSALKSRDQFRSTATPIVVKAGAVPFQVDPKEFSTGSLGWYLNGKATLDCTSGYNAVTLSVNGALLQANPFKFSTGSVGWYANGKVNVELSDGTIVVCQVGCNLTIVGTKGGDGSYVPDGIVNVQCGVNITVVGSKDLPKTGSIANVA